MEEDQEVIKHVCRICCKSFPCGRSLGGHMRSHDHEKTNDHHHDDVDDDDDDDDDDGDDESFVVVSASTTVKKEEGCSEGYYGLRENPKKTWRALTDSTSDHDQEETFDVVLDKLCKECGRGFRSWKALFGHMKCHSSSKNNAFELDEQESNTAAVLPNRKRRSKRRLKTRYVKGNSSSSVVIFAANSVSEDELEQEEVAMSLMMLSRDVRSWSGLNSIAESSDNNDNNDNNDNKSVELEAPLTRLVSSNLKSKEEKSLEILDDRLKMKKTRVSVKDKMKIEVDSDSAFEVNVRSKPGTSSTSKAKYTSMKEKFYECETKVSSEAEIGAKKSSKRGKFECATCNRSFRSYQALGGHRAGHKRSKGCFASKIDQNSENENNAELEVDIKINVPDEGVVEEVPEIRNFLDLNLPADASIVDERNGHSEIYTPWWLDGSKFKQESMVGLLSN